MQVERIVRTIDSLGYLRCVPCAERSADHPIVSAADLPEGMQPVYERSAPHNTEPCDFCQDASVSAWGSEDGIAEIREYIAEHGGTADEAVEALEVMYAQEASLWRPSDGPVACDDCGGVHRGANVGGRPGLCGRR
jgi:hypothetical protein